MSCSDETMSGNDVLFKRGDGGNPETFVTRATVTDLDSPTLKAETKPTTKRGAGWKTYKKKPLRDGGQVKLKIQSRPGHTDWDDLEADVRGDDCGRTYQLFFQTTNDTLTFTGIATEFKMMTPQDDDLEAEITLKVSGEPVWS